MSFGRWLCCLLLATAAVASAQDKKDPERRAFRLEWRDLDRMVHGKNIDITLPSGIRLKGRVMAIEQDAMTLDVGKTSNKRAYPKGRSVVPRAEVTRFRLARREEHRWSAIGAGIGGAIGVFAAIGAAQVPVSDGAKAGAAGLAVAIPAAIGFGFGWAADHESVDIIVVPDGAGPDLP
jgi:hypothetical protein